MEQQRHIRDVLEEEVIYDHSQFGLLNSQVDDSPLSLSNCDVPPHKKMDNKWSKLSRTAALCGAYISLGLCFSVTGPTLLYLKDQVGATIPEISYIFTLRSAGTLGGAFIGGFLLDRCNPYSAFFVIMSMMAISVGAMPWCKKLWMLMASSVVIGVGNGLLDTGASTLCLQLWGKDSGPYMQALHFSFAVGGSIAPLLVQAFIVEVSTPLNSTMSSRHVRSVTSPLNSSDLDDESMATSIIEAVTNLPIALENVNTTTSSSTLPTTSTTPTPVILQNQTVLTTEKLKKLKPEVINGGALGSSSQFEKIPLPKIDPPPKEIAVPSTTIASNETTTTSPRTEAIDLLDNVTTKAQELNTTVSTMLHSPAIGVELNVTDTMNDTDIGSAKNDSTPLSDFQKGSEVKVSFVSSTTNPSLPIETSGVMTTPLSTPNPVTTSSKSDVPGESKSNELSVSNVTKDFTQKDATFVASSTTVAPSTTSQLLSTSAEITSALQTTASPTQSKPISIANDVAIIPTTSTVSTDSTETMVVKSRGKFRGQQDETNTVVPSMTAVTQKIDSEHGVNVIETTPSAPLHNESENIDQTPIRVSDYLERFGVTRMHMLYTVIAIIVLHTAFAFLFFHCSGTRNSAVVTADRHAADRKIKPFRPSAKLSFVALMFTFYLMYVGAEVIFAQFLTTFALESPLKLPTSTANYITTTFWVTFAAGRFVAIFVAHFVNPTAMLIFNMGATTLGSTALCIAAQTDVSILYVGSGMIGLGMASTFATGFVWTETHLLVTNRISAAFSVASSMGEMIFPTVTGSLMESHPMSLMYLVLALTVFSAFVLFLAWLLAKRKGRGFNFRSSGYRLARQADDDLLQH